MQDTRLKREEGPAPTPVPGVAALAPYRQGRVSLQSRATPIKLSSNESHQGPCPGAIESFHDWAATMNRYPNGSQSGLREAIAETFGLDASGILCGNGSDEIISLLMRCYLRPGDQVVISQYSFAMAFVHAAVQGVTIEVADEAGLKPDADAILSKVTDETRMVVLASPNNPIGQYISGKELRRLHASLPTHVILLIDAAYADYVTQDDYEDGSDLVKTSGNVVMTRTFSKLYGLAGLRVGWAFMPQAIHDIVERVRTPFNVNGAALATAEAAVIDQGFAATVRAENRRELDRLEAAISAIGIEFVPSHANFYLLRFGERGATLAGVVDALERAGIIPRPVNAGGPASCLRITVGLPHENDAVLTALQIYMASIVATCLPAD